MPNIKEKYIKKVAPALRAQFGYKNPMSVPHIEKVVINSGVGRFREEKDRDEVVKFLSLIAGQRPNARPAKKAIAAFKTREGLIIGYRATLRGSRMYDFLSRLVDIALPRTRDFRGIPVKGFDQKGNLTIGIKEHIVFPEMIGEDYRFLFGCEVTVVTTATTKEEGIALLKELGFPIQDKED